MSPHYFVLSSFAQITLICLVVGAASIWSSSAANAGTVDGKMEVQHRYFPDQRDGEQIQNQTSVSLSMEYFTDWNDGDDRLEVEIFGRADAEDDERTHADIRQFLWTHYGSNYEISAGLGRVFWGVTETQHLVDIVNQTDLVENIDGEDKLGQPMVRYQRFTDYGSFEAFILPYFRERTFEGPNGRLNAGLRFADQEIYESNSEEKHIDYALRYSNTLGMMDLGLSWFSGTSREPELFLVFDPATGTSQPFYPQIDQLGIDMQLTVGGWLLKLEAIQRNFDNRLLDDFVAATLGFEYTLVGIMGTTYDLGLLTEYSWDERRETTLNTPFQNDLTLGGRLALNDIADSQFLLGVSQDLTFSDSISIFLEGSTRINNQLSLNLEARYFSAEDQRDPLFAFKDSSFLQMGLEFFF